MNVFFELVYNVFLKRSSTHQEQTLFITQVDFTSLSLRDTVFQTNTYLIVLNAIERVLAYGYVSLLFCIAHVSSNADLVRI